MLKYNKNSLSLSKIKKFRTMKKNFKVLTLSCLCLFVLQIMAQEPNGKTLAGRNTGQSAYPQKEYVELSNPIIANPADWNKVSGTNVRWGSTDVRYKKEVPPTVLESNTKQLIAWRGERVAAQFVVWNKESLPNLNFEVSDFTSAKNIIPKENVLSAFVRYVMTDELNKDKNGACGNRLDPTKWDSTLVADVLDPTTITKQLSLPPMNTQAGWIRVWVPQDATPGTYTGKVTVKSGDKLLNTLTLKVTVKNRTLPAVEDWKFHLDLWQNPYAIARYYKVEPWSKEHFDAMRPVMKMYQQAGGKVITASIMHKPWNGQTFDYFESMITWVKKLDGTWTFDFSIFDKWVQFMMDLGVKKEIGCYSMVPWALQFLYFDQATNSMRSIKMQPGDTEYDNIWTQLLKSFAQHLKEKGWFDITHISMDERSLDVMLKTLKIIHNADPKFKISMAGGLHKELLDELNDYCIPIRLKFSKEAIEARRAEGKITTFYTCCAEPYPNTFTFSPSAEAEWIPLYSAKANLDGYLRWALNSWVPEPLLDSRFTNWAAGDTYILYPGRTSIRFERLTQGIQDYEKIRILRDEFTKSGNKSGIQKIENALKPMDELKLNTTPAANDVNRVKKVLNEF